MLGDQQLYDYVRAAFRRQGRSLYGYCRRHGINRPHARFALLGLRNGAAARQLRSQLCLAAGVSNDDDASDSLPARHGEPADLALPEAHHVAKRERRAV